MGFESFDDICNTGLVLGLGFTPATAVESPPASEKPCLKMDYSHQAICLGPALTLGISAGESYKRFDSVVESSGAGAGVLYRQDSTGASSFSNGSVKREREICGGGNNEDLEMERALSSRASDEDDDGLNHKKKLRLTKDQSALLEESFKHHSTLNPKQKQELARKLNLRARQVEVWFQNRRARTKLKQTEVDLEFLKKCCETLTEENRRLQKELHDLKSLKLAQPFYMQLPAATLTMCPSCERIAGDNNKGPSKKPFTKSPLFNNNNNNNNNQFTNQSAAC